MQHPERPDVAPYVRDALKHLNKILGGLDIPPVEADVMPGGSLRFPHQDTSVRHARAMLYGLMDPIRRMIGLSAWAVFQSVVTGAGQPRVNMFVLRTDVQVIESLGSLGERLISAEEARQMMSAATATARKITD